ncbi:hydrogenase expression/formation C-terminal domain-containing protein [Mesobacterium sp. TK19101]|uniref:Hydrogenase expression/formation C-terminal domain-containing protein n=1 Tax=Mesobacterium hydrothermale TaxID=3111907 RepID=A0ABU6HJZ3_9RHOB|nr:hydrogenase expression/formation C-terminal domain-containing protein [Mesobacterium sp. TK19101]MEC3862772.1 hydrogenase expression/formation C-terminal domain-containing protein [Mesobacterium sp. TK19101]
MDDTLRQAQEARTGIADSLVVEIADRLTALAQTGDQSAIDLRALPMTAADRADLEAFLGRGEVTADLSVAGRSEVWETRFAGVWWLRHLMADGRVAAETIEITRIPDLLVAASEDVATAASNLRKSLNGPGTTRQEAEATNG